MERDAVLVAQLRAGLAGWQDIIRRSTGVREIRFLLDDEGGLSIIGIWHVGTSAEEREYKKTFTPRDLFGHTLDLSPAGRHLVKRPCDCAREYIREMLQHRGIL